MILTQIVPSGFFHLDKITSGFWKSDLIVLAGRPAMGKTAFAVNIALNAASQKIPVAIFSLETGKEQLMMRMLSNQARMKAHELDTGFISQDDWIRITDAAKTLSKTPIYVDDSPAISSSEISAIARTIKNGEEIGLIIVDHLQLMRSDLSNASRHLEISRSLKALAKELNTPVLALSQLNREVDERRDTRPKLADLDWSGDIGSHSDVVLFIYREEVYNKSDDNPNRGTAEIIVAKHRNGPTGTVKLAFLESMRALKIFDCTLLEDITLIVSSRIEKLTNASLMTA